MLRPWSVAALRFFAEAIGETARSTPISMPRALPGYRDLPAPPTFLFGLELDGPDPFGWLADLGVDLRSSARHQRFVYHHLVFAGDGSLPPRIADVYEKEAVRWSSSSKTEVTEARRARRRADRDHRRAHPSRRPA